MGWHVGHDGPSRLPDHSPTSRAAQRSEKNAFDTSARRMHPTSKTYKGDLGVPDRAAARTSPFQGVGVFGHQVIGSSDHRSGTAPRRGRRSSRCSGAHLTTWPCPRISMAMDSRRSPRGRHRPATGGSARRETGPASSSGAPRGTSRSPPRERPAIVMTGRRPRLCWLSGAAPSLPAFHLARRPAGTLPSRRWFDVPPRGRLAACSSW